VEADPRTFLLSLFDTAVEAAHPRHSVPRNLPSPPRGRTIVIGAGKAAAAMAEVVEAHWSGPLTGLVVTRYGYGAPCKRIEVVEAGHPVPDDAGRQAAKRMLDMVHGLSSDDLVLSLISGGGSSLLAVPAPGISLEDKQVVTHALLRSGARISEFNCVRKHLSSVKGGRLARAASPARVVSLIISDVPGDDPSIVASGPTSPDPTTSADALEILKRYAIAVPPSVESWLRNPGSETPKRGHPALAGVSNIVIAAANDALAAAARAGKDRGYQTLVLGDAIEGEARVVAHEHAALAMSCLAKGAPLAPPCILISGGETTVTVKGKGRGGRNSEYLLALAVALQAAPGIWAIACDTDGIDGTEDNAGAVIGPDTLARAASRGADPNAALANNDSYEFFSILGDLVKTGPTRTNVNDFRAVLIQPPAK
jgi:hydroxypyruvate reductase